MKLIIFIDFLKFYTCTWPDPHRSIKHWTCVIQTKHTDIKSINSSFLFCSPTHNVGNRNGLGCCVPELRASKNICCSQRLHWMGGEEGGAWLRGALQPSFWVLKTKISGIQLKWIQSWHVRWGGCSEHEAQGPGSCSVFKCAPDLTVRPYQSHFKENGEN